MFAPITRWSDGVPTPLAIPEMFRKAFKLAETERPGAVYLAIPENIDDRRTPRSESPARNVVRARGTLTQPGRPRRRTARDGAAAGDPGRPRRGARRTRPPRCCGCREALGIRVANTFHGKGVMPDDHPQRHRAPSGSCGTTTSTSASTTPT